MTHRNTILTGLILFFTLALAPAAGHADLTFSGGTVQAYFRGVVTTTGPCLQLCGAGSPCYVRFSQTPSVVRMWTDYDGPGPCTYCGCCMEAAAMSTGVIRVILFVDPATGKPLPPSQGGVPVTEGVPPGARLKTQDWLAEANSCVASYCDDSCYAASAVAFEGASVAESQVRPICGDGPYLNNILLQGNGAGFLAFVATKANNCSWAIAEVRINNPTVTVPVDSVFPLETAGRRQETITVKWTNLSADPVSNLTLEIYDADGNWVDELSDVEVEPLQELRWTVTGATRRGTVRALGEQSGGYALPYPAPVGSSIARTPIAPHVMILDSAQQGNAVNVVLQSGSQLGGCRLGTLSFELDSTAPAGVSTVPAGNSLLASDEFEDSSLGTAWATVNPSAPQSSISLSARPGFLQLRATAAGQGADLWIGSNMNAPRVVQNVNWNSDFELITRLEFAPSDDYEGAGILVNGSRMAERAFAAPQGGNIVRNIGGYSSFNSPVTWFRLVKQANMLTGYYSADGSNWTVGGSTSAPSAGCIGLFCVRKNWQSGGNHDAVADFDFFRFTQMTAAPASQAGSQVLRVAPNPMGRSTTIFLELTHASEVDLYLFDVRGRQVRKIEAGNLSIGPHRLEWDGRDADGESVAAGTYFYRVQAGGREWNGKLMVLR